MKLNEAKFDSKSLALCHIYCVYKFNWIEIAIEEKCRFSVKLFKNFAFFALCVNFLFY